MQAVGVQFYQKETPEKVFCKIFQDGYFIEYLCTAASVHITSTADFLKKFPFILLLRPSFTLLFLSFELYFENEPSISLGNCKTIFKIIFLWQVLDLQLYQDSI